jgi:acyl-CoA reductase-like NAD-dependent aldehyde dehydrogenase
VAVSEHRERRPPPEEEQVVATETQLMPVEAPATGRTIDEVAVAGAAEVAELAARARTAQVAWRERSFRERTAVLDAARRWLARNADRMRETICRETGKTDDDAQLEIAVALQSFAFWSKRSERYLAEERFRTWAPMVLGRKVTVRYDPYGLVGVIGPWNYPLVNAFCDCVPALMAGNAVLLKPSEVTPLTALLTAEMLAESGMPEGVFTVVNGGRETGEAVVDAVDYVMFTGSTATGQAVMRRAADTVTPVSLELGGKDAMIVCADANLERAANAAAFSALCNSGQVCISVERIYVEDAIYDRFVARLGEIVQGLRQGAAGGPGSVEVGAITHPPQIEIIERHVRDALDKGARAVTGGARRSGPGRFFEPTVLADVDHSMSCMTEETFGPTIPVMRVADVDEAIRLANDSPYGLQGSVFTSDAAKGEAIARRMECGAVCVNDALVNYMVFDAPMGGWKTSGIGSRHGAGGIRKYCRTQTILGTGPQLKRDVHHFPYSPRVSKLLAGFVGRLYGR